MVFLCNHWLLPVHRVTSRIGEPSTKSAGLYRYASLELYWNLISLAVHRIHRMLVILFSAYYLYSIFG
jgi:hypothetical protein